MTAILPHSPLLPSRHRPPPLAGPLPVLSDLFPASPLDAGAVGFVQAALPRAAQHPVLWLQDRLSALETGRPFRPEGPMLYLQANRPVDVLRAMEDGLGCGALSAVVAEIWGAPAALDFTATKRLALRAEAGGLPCWLIRRGTTPDLSAARNRWRVASLPALPHPDDAQAPGAPRWRVELFRSRLAKPGTWVVRHDRAADRLDFSAPCGDGALAEDRGADRQRALG